MLPSSWIFSARTLDDTKLYMATLETVPRGTRFTATAPSGAAGLSWASRYGFVGVTWAAEDPGVYDDGMNEHGLSVAQNQLDETAYPNVTHASRAVGMRSVVGWLLGSAANVIEARALLEARDASGARKVQVWGRAGGGPGGDAGAERQHLHVLDAAGGELLVEWVGGQQRLYDSSDGAWGTTTNSPDFPTMRSLRRYSAQFPTGYDDRGAVPGGRGGLNGVPAALDSLSRQARARVINAMRPRLNTTAQAVAWSFRLLDFVSVPGVPGGAGAGGGGRALPADGVNDFTQWQLVRDHRPAERALYSRTWDNLVPKRVALASCNFSASATKQVFAMGEGNWAEPMAAAHDEV
eukprot:g3709.t1